MALRGRGMAEDELVVCVEGRALVVALSSMATLLGHRYAAARSLGLGLAEFAAGDIAPDANHPGGPVNIAPAQRDQLALAQSVSGGVRESGFSTTPSSSSGIARQQRVEFGAAAPGAGRSWLTGLRDWSERRGPGARGDREGQGRRRAGAGPADLAGGELRAGTAPGRRGARPAHRAGPGRRAHRGTGSGQVHESPPPWWPPTGNGGQRVAVLAVDPTSPFSGGALLGDRVRMQDHATDPDVFIRSMATLATSAGLSEGAAPQALRVLDAAGFAVLLVETVGGGPGRGRDRLARRHQRGGRWRPGMGDAIQAAKAGILEVGDVFVVNKADKPGCPGSSPGTCGA